MSTGPAAVRTGLPALVACLCAVAVLFTLGGYLRVSARLDQEARRLEALEEASRGQARAALEGREALDRLLVRLDRLDRQWQSLASALPEEGPGPRRAQSEAGPLGPAEAVPEDVPDAWTGRIVSLAPRRGGAAAVDGGGRDGLRPEDRLAVFRGGRYLGDLRVGREVTAHMAVCRPAGGGGFRVGDRVRRDMPD